MSFSNRGKKQIKRGETALISIEDYILRRQRFNPPTPLSPPNNGNKK